MNDRRRVNGPPGGTVPAVFATSRHVERPQRTRAPDQLRKIYLKTGLTPSASGSAYLELEPSAPPLPRATSLIPRSSSLKLTCTVHGPKPLPRSAPFSPQLLLSTHVKFAPFAARQRRGYIRDAGERDLGAHLEAALRGVIIGERWPKSGVDIVVTVLEGEEDGWWGDEAGIGGAQKSIGGWGMMTVLAGCITVASAAITAAGIDCVDLVTGGVAALVRSPGSTSGVVSQAVEGTNEQEQGHTEIVLDPCPREQEEVIAACVVGYLASRDELTEVWMKGDLGSDAEMLVDRAAKAAVAARGVLSEAVKESAAAKFSDQDSDEPDKSKKARVNQDVEMSG